MTIEIMLYEDKFRGDLKLMLGDYLHLVAKEVKHEPWKFEINVLEAVDFTFKNLSDFVPPNGKIFIAKKSSECVGTASLKKIRPKIAEIKRMYVKPEFQGVGIGNLLLEKALEEAKTLNFEEVFLDTPPPFKASHQLYKKHGFQGFQEYPEVAIPDELKVDWVYMKKVL